MKKKCRRIITMALILAMILGLNLTALAEKSVEKEQEFVLTDEVTGYGVPLESQGLKGLIRQFMGSGVSMMADSAVPTEAEAYRAMNAFRTTYPEGMHWTNDDYYAWKGGIFGGGYGCAGFAFMLSDAAFGNLPARQIKTDISISKVHVGDILRVNGDKHSVIVIEVYTDHVVLAEGNYNSSIHWDRVMTAEEVAASDYIMTRYPAGTFTATCTLTYNTNGGTGGPGVQRFEKGQTTIISKTIPSKGLLTFRGWAKTANATAPDYIPGDSFKSDQNATLYAVWGEPSAASISNTFPTTYPVVASGSSGSMATYRFVPSKSSWYSFESTSDYDTIITISDADGSTVGSDDDSGVDYNYKLEVYLTAGTTYFIRTGFYPGESATSFQMTVSKIESDTVEKAGFIYIPNSDGTATIVDCTLKGDIVIPEKLDGYTIVGLGEKLFYGYRGITTVSIPKTVKAPDTFDYIFSYCYDLTSINVDSANPYLCSVDGVLYTKDKTTLYNYPIAKSGTTFKTLAETNYLCCTSFASARNLTSLYLTNKQTTWAGFTFFNTPNMKVYYYEGGNSAKMVKNHIELEKTHETNSDYPTFVVYSDPVMLSTPVLKSAASGAKGITVSWNAVSGAQKYRVFRKVSGGSWAKLTDVSGSTTSYTDTTAVSGTTYAYTVRCLSADGSTYVSNYDATGKSATYIAQPAVSSLNNAANGVQVSWNAVKGAAQYRVFYKVGTGAWTGYNNTTGTSMTVTGLTAGKSYSFTVRCVSADGKTYTSTYDTTGKTIVYQPVAKTLAKPEITGLNSNASGVQVTWGAVSGAAQYRVFYKTATGAWTSFADVKGTSTTVTGLTSGTTYTFLVRCLSADAKTYTSDYDASKSKSLTYIAQPAVSGLTNMSNGVQVKWNAVAGAAQYRVFYKAGNGSWTGFNNTTGTSLTVTGLTAGTTYSFTVRCISADGKTYTSTYDTTGKSIVYKPTGAALASPEISSLTNTANGVKVTWGAVSGAAQYRIFYRIGTGAWETVGSTTGTSKEVTGLTAGTTYTFLVRCLSADGKAYTSDYDATKSKSITYQPTNNTMLETPVITVLKQTDEGVNIVWNPVPGAAQYRLFYKVGDGSWTGLVNIPSCNVVVSKLLSGYTYSFTVRCISADGTTFTSNYDTVGKSITIK